MPRNTLATVKRGRGLVRRGEHGFYLEGVTVVESMITVGVLARSNQLHQYPTLGPTYSDVEDLLS